MKRFSETSRFDEDWYSTLPLEMKAAFEFLWAKADAAGVWTVSPRTAELHIGKKVNWPEFVKRCGGRIIVLDSERYYLRDFVRVNCGKLSRDCRAHTHIFDALEKQGINPETLLPVMLPDSYPIPIPMLSDSTKTRQEEYKDKEPDKDKRGDARGDSFDEFWQAYPNRVGKGKAEEAWRKHGCEKILPQILISVRTCKTSEQWTRDGGRFIPHPATWLNRRGWEDELLPPTSTKNGAHSIVENIKCPVTVIGDSQK